MTTGNSTDATALSNAKARAANAQTWVTQGNYSQALTEYVQTAQSLHNITGTLGTANPGSALQATVLMLQTAERQLCNQWACITGALGFTVSNVEVREVPLLATIVGRRIVYNSCQPQIKDIPVTSSWVNRSTGISVENLWDNLTIPGLNNNRLDNGWQAQGNQNDIIDVLLTAQWQGETLHLARDAFGLIVLPPKLTGTVTVNPTHAKASANVTISTSENNSGAMSSNIPVTITVTNTTKGGTVLWISTQNMTFNPGQSSSGNTNWFVNGTGGDQVLITLTATVGGVVQTLGSTNFTIDN